MVSSKCSTEEAENRRELKGPSTSMASIEQRIKYKYFFSGFDAIERCCNEDAPIRTKLLTICVLVMKNGFIITGSSAPVSPDNYDEKQGQVNAYENAIRQLRPLEAYALAERIKNNGVRNDVLTKVKRPSSQRPASDGAGLHGADSTVDG